MSIENRRGAAAIPGTETVVRGEEELRLAVHEYKRTSGRLFPTLCEILEILMSLGYRKSITPHVPNKPARSKLPGKPMSRLILVRPPTLGEVRDHRR